jgi:F-type H+-transporting ATPase subunit a
MENFTELLQLKVTLFGICLRFNVETVLMTWIVMGSLIIFGFLATRRVAFVPNPLQVVGELFVSAFYGLCQDALDEEMGKKYFPLICALFMFLLLSNWLGIIPKLSEPTKDLNTPLSMGIMGFVIAHYAGIRTKGIKQYMKEYMEPIFFMAPLNIIGELAKVVSISFRLFGNIMGGAIIILVISHLIYSLLLPPLLVLFFSLFVGTIQAFVFTMLTLVYISVQVK